MDSKAPAEEAAPLDRGFDHRERVLLEIRALWERHPSDSFCELINAYVISIGTMASHTSDEDVVESCRDGCRDDGDDDS
jgi:hypothetical protein